MKAKKKKNYSSPPIKKLLNFLSHSMPLSLSLSLSLSQSLNSHPLPKLFQSLKLSSSLSHSPLTVDRLTVLSRQSPHRPKPPISDRLTVPSRRSPHRPKLPIASWSLTSLPTQLTNPPLLPTQLADIVLVCDW